MTTTSFTKEMADKLSEKLKQLPPLPPSKIQLNKQQLIEQMADGIHAARQQGYTLAQIAEVLAGENADISLSALKRYLPRSATTRKKQPKKTSKTSPIEPIIQPNEPTHSSSFVPFKEPDSY